MIPATQAKLLRVGAKPVIAALAQRGVKGRTLTRLPPADPFAGTVALTVEACRPGSVLVAEIAAPAADRLRQRGIETVARRDLRGLRPEAGDGLLRDRDSLVVIPAPLVDEVAEAAAEAVAFEEFTADQVAQGGGVYGLHIPSGDRARQAFAQWRRLKGR
jgi:regulator of RNase E activity RraA